MYSNNSRSSFFIEGVTLFIAFSILATSSIAIEQQSTNLIEPVASQFTEQYQ